MMWASLYCLHTLVCHMHATESSLTNKNAFYQTPSTGSAGTIKGMAVINHLMNNLLDVMHLLCLDNGCIQVSLGQALSNPNEDILQTLDPCKVACSVCCNQFNMNFLPLDQNNLTSWTILYLTENGKTYLYPNFYSSFYK